MFFKKRIIIGTLALFTLGCIFHYTNLSAVVPDESEFLSEFRTFSKSVWSTTSDVGWTK
jgi:hypothetical protein